MKRTYFYLFSLVMTLTSCVNGIAPSKNKITKKYSVDCQPGYRQYCIQAK